MADDRERNDRLFLSLKEAGDTVVLKSRLGIGDFLLDNLLIERKSFADFCLSITDGRLFRQAKQLASSSVQPVIILEGTSADLKSTGMKREAIQGALITLTLLFRIPVLRSQSPEETARLILFACKQIENSRFSQKNYSRPSPNYNRLKRKEVIQAHILQGFPGIGPIRAKQLINRFGTLTSIFNASHKQLAEVPGIGKRAIKHILDMLN